MEMIPLVPTISRTTGTTGLERIAKPPTSRSRMAINPMVVTTTAKMRVRFVLQMLYSHATRTIVGAAISVDRAMRLLAAPMLRPSRIRLPGSHNNTPKFTKPTHSAVRVKAPVKPSNLRILTGEFEGGADADL